MDIWSTNTDLRNREKVRQSKTTLYECSFYISYAYDHHMFSMPWYISCKKVLHPDSSGTPNTRGQYDWMELQALLYILHIYGVYIFSIILTIPPEASSASTQRCSCIFYKYPSSVSKNPPLLSKPMWTDISRAQSNTLLDLLVNTNP